MTTSATAIQSNAIQLTPGALTPGVTPSRLPILPWRDPYSVPPEKLAEFIGALREACLENPDHVDLHTCLGIAHAMNYDVYASMDALESARRIDAGNFLAQFKYAELNFRLRALDKAQLETTRALELAGTSWELSVARRQLSEIRRLLREGTQKPPWTKSLVVPALGFVLLLTAISCIYMLWK